MLKAWRRIKIENEFIYLFLRSRVAQLAALVALICILGAVLAPLIAPSNPYDLATFDILDSFTPPAWSDGGNPQFFIGTDDQGRDLLSSIM
ncbi:MAG: ABC transporter permease, partial [Lentilitoribacter sp.]